MNPKEMPKLPLVLIAAMFVAGTIAYPHLPARIPTHWNAAGEIDAWADRSFVTVYSEPLMALGLYVLFMVMPYFDPRRRNVLRSKQVYFLVLELVTGLLAVVFAGTLLAAFDPSFPMDRIVLVGTGVMFLVLGNHLGRVKPNWTMGVRYSWTLSDEVVWVKTNRLGGRLFAAGGVLTIACAFLPAPANVIVMLGWILAILPVTYVYSMVLYKKRHPEEMAPPAANEAQAADEEPDAD
ncbi:MAG: DUF1648 domain-containing protein [Coriobacteriia bacterium]|nr:DUF1648 domain-containing protein [Coriobacteriia bacterium]MDI6843146.1 DUF1648 domain-containing protein [Anaerosomatales bacterium]